MGDYIVHVVVEIYVYWGNIQENIHNIPTHQKHQNKITKCFTIIRKSMKREVLCSYVALKIVLSSTKKKKKNDNFDEKGIQVDLINAYNHHSLVSLL